MCLILVYKREPLGLRQVTTSFWKYVSKMGLLSKNNLVRVTTSMSQKTEFTLIRNWWVTNKLVKNCLKLLQILESYRRTMELKFYQAKKKVKNTHNCWENMTRWQSLNIFNKRYHSHLSVSSLKTSLSIQNVPTVRKTVCMRCWWRMHALTILRLSRHFWDSSATNTLIWSREEQKCS